EGTNMTTMLSFKKDYKEAHTIILEQNYRSTKSILDADNTVIKNNEGRQDKKLWTENQSGEKINYFKGSSERDEALFITEKIQNLIENQEYSPNDIAILYRTNAQSRAIED